jgi:hypothetical protein
MRIRASFGIGAAQQTGLIVRSQFTIARWARAIGDRSLLIKPKMTQFDSGAAARRSA